MNKPVKKREISVVKGLNESEFMDIKGLIEICYTYDNCNKNEKDFILPPKDESNEYLLYKEDNIIGFLGIHPSFAPREVKITGKVHPLYRRQGVFTERLNKAKDICKSRHINTMVIINEESLESGREFCTSIGGNLAYTTYKMKLANNSLCHQGEELNNLTFRLASTKDADEVIKLGMESFGTTEEDEKSYFKLNMGSVDRDVYLGELDNTVISTVTTIKQNNQASICDLSVLEKLRKQGIGRTMLLEVVKVLINQEISNISLSVETKNTNALSLYENCGFRIIGSNDFYKVVI